MKLTHRQVFDTLQRGDVIVVHYLRQNVVAAGIQFASGGTASHALCSLGAFDIVEADLGGVMHTNLDNYFKGNCRLTIKRLRRGVSHFEQLVICDYWRSCVSQPYDLGMIVHALVVFPVRRFLLPRAPRLARLLLGLLGKIPLASHRLSTCAELGARGIRKAAPGFLRTYAPEDITPEVLLRDTTSLETVAVWEGPVLEEAF